MTDTAPTPTTADRRLHGWHSPAPAPPTHTSRAAPPSSSGWPASSPAQEIETQGDEAPTTTTTTTTTTTVGGRRALHAQPRSSITAPIDDAPPPPVPVPVRACLRESFHIISAWRCDYHSQQDELICAQQISPNSSAILGENVAPSGDATDQRCHHRRAAIMLCRRRAADPPQCLPAMRSRTPPRRLGRRAGGW